MLSNTPTHAHIITHTHTHTHTIIQCAIFYSSLSVADMFSITLCGRIFIAGRVLVRTGTICVSELSFYKQVNVAISDGGLSAMSLRRIGLVQVIREYLNTQSQLFRIPIFWHRWDAFRSSTHSGQHFTHRFVPLEGFLKSAEAKCLVS